MTVTRMDADPPSLEWKDVPDRPGWYWYRRYGQRMVQGPIAVFQAYGELCFNRRGFDSRPEPCRFERRQWAGPVARPVEP